MCVPIFCYYKGTGATNPLLCSSTPHFHAPSFLLTLVSTDPHFHTPSFPQPLVSTHPRSYTPSFPHTLIPTHPHFHTPSFPHNLRLPAAKELAAAVALEDSRQQLQQHAQLLPHWTGVHLLPLLQAAIACKDSKVGGRVRGVPLLQAAVACK
jgi:hypothetical protein